MIDKLIRSKLTRSTQASQELSNSSGFRSLFPLLLFVICFVGSGITLTLLGVEQGFYKISPTIIIMPAVMLAVVLSKESVPKTIQQFLKGSGHINVITMCFIYLLAGAFGQAAVTIGAVDSTVNLALTVLSSNLLLPGILITTALISISMGSALGTISAMAPIALGIAEAASIPPALIIGTVVGGAMFGDNLSMISDTTIAAVQTQGCSLKDKFIINSKIALPAMLCTMVLLFGLGYQGEVTEIGPYQIIKVVPYAAVLALALWGVDVLVVLIAGILIAGAVGAFTVDSFTLLVYTDCIFQGFSNMREIFFLSMMIGGLGALVKAQGGISYLIAKITKVTQRFSGKKASPVAGELGISALVSIADACTAINTVAILISGDAAKQIAKKSQISPQRSASLMDIFACVFQGLLPYSAQILLAGTLTGLSPLAIVAHVHYCYILGVIALAAVIFQYGVVAQISHSRSDFG